MAADATAGHIRVCHFYTDGDGSATGTVEGFAPGVSITAPTSGSNEGTAAQRLAGTICTAALPVITNKPAILGNITAADMTVLATTGPNEDNALTAPNPTDADGVTSATFTWQWSQADTHGGTYTNISGATSASFTPVDAQVNSFLRVCVSFEDDEENAEQVCASLPHAVVNINDAPTHPANGGDLSSTPNRFVEDMPATIMTDGIMDDDGLEGVVFEVRWYAGTGDELQTFLLDGKSAVFPRPPVHIGPTFTPLQEHTAVSITTQTPSAILACVFFTDNHGTAERYCKTLHGTSNVDDVPTGQITIGQFDTNTSTSSRTHNPEQGQEYFVGLTSIGGTFADEDGVPSTNLLADPAGISWQTSASPLGPWSEQSFGRNMSKSNFGYTLDNDDANAGWIRACLFYTDSQSGFNGLTPDNEGERQSSHARIRNQREGRASYCTASHPVANVNDAPSAAAGNVIVPVGGSYAFRAEDFPFTDVDGDNLSAVVVATLPADGKGTLTLIDADTGNSGAVTASDSITVADIRAGRFIYTPPSTQTAAADDFASFTFNVTDDGSHGSGDRTSTTAATLSIDLVAAAADAATGDPAITIPIQGGALTELETLRADITNIMDANGIRTSTIRYEWSQAIPTPLGAIPAMTSGSWRIISRSAGTDITLAQEQVGNFIRLCVIFEDYTDNTERRCTTTSDAVADINIPPSSVLNIISVPATATADDPYILTLDDFVVFDEDGDPLDSIYIISTAISSGIFNGVVRLDGTVLTASTNHTITAAQIAAGQLTYYPTNSPQTPRSNFGQFQYSPITNGVLGTVRNNPIYLTVPSEGAASGRPTLNVTEAVVGQEIEAADTSIVAPAGVDSATWLWEWQQSDDGIGGWATFATDTLASIANRNVVDYTPTNFQAGKYLRACVSFDNSLGQAEGPLCSLPIRVAPLPIVNVAFNDGAVQPESNVSHAIVASLSSVSTADTYLTFTIESGEGSWADDIRNITIPAGETSTAFSLTLVTADNIVAANDRQTVISVQADNSAGVVPPPDLIFTILEDDELRTNLQAAGTGDEGDDEYQACVTFSTPFVGEIAINASLRVDPDLTGNTATPADASLVSDTVVARPGDTQKCYEINLHNNHRQDGPRGFATSFEAVSVDGAIKNLTLGDSSTTFTITDDEASGRPAWQDFSNSNTVTHGILTALTEDATYSIATTTAGANLRDDSSGVIPDREGKISRSYQIADSADGPWRELEANAFGVTHIPRQDQVGKYVRACIFFRDTADNDSGNWEGGPPDSMGAAYSMLSQAQRLAGTLCTHRPAGHQCQ